MLDWLPNSVACPYRFEFFGAGTADCGWVLIRQPVNRFDDVPSTEQ